MTYKTLKTDSKSDKGIDVTDFPVIKMHTRHNERVGISITPIQWPMMFEIVAVVIVSREQWQTFQSLAHQASAVPTQKLKLPATNNKTIKCRKASHIDGTSRMYVTVASCAAAKLPSKPYS